MKYSQEEVKSHSWPQMTVSEYKEKYWPHLSHQAINHNIRNNQIDYSEIGKTRVVVLTEKTLTFVPRAQNGTRTIKPKLDKDA